MSGSVSKSEEVARCIRMCVANEELNMERQSRHEAMKRLDFQEGGARGGGSGPTLVAIVTDIVFVALYCCVSAAQTSWHRRQRERRAEDGKRLKSKLGSASYPKQRTISIAVHPPSYDEVVGGRQNRF